MDQMNSAEEMFDGEDLEIRVSNAGIILFWPFLTRFFEKLDLLENDVFINENTINKAVYVLQYLAYNSIDFPEYELTLNKTLVGMLPHETLLSITPLSKEAKNMAASLNSGLIGNWEKVKDSTPEAIQETFIQREGQLKFKKDQLLLKVDKKGVDVLVELIPWNLSLIRLPWMQKPLHVEWI